MGTTWKVLAGMTLAAEVDDAKIQKLEAELDPEMRFRPLLPAAASIVAIALFGLSCFHYYTAGFGLLPETLHRGIHIAKQNCHGRLI